MRFAYYARLKKAQKKTYDASDAIAVLEIPGADSLGVLARAIEAVLPEGRRGAVQKASQKFVDAVTKALGVERVIVRVLATRPSTDESELHGLYVREEGEEPIIRVWMRTAARKDVVRPRTFVRTLVHELVHHLDYTHLGLDDSFHTHGFYRRESRLVRQVLGETSRQKTAAPAEDRPRPGPSQLSLFGEGED